MSERVLQVLYWELLGVLLLIVLYLLRAMSFKLLPLRIFSLYYLIAELLLYNVTFVLHYIIICNCKL